MRKIFTDLFLVSLVVLLSFGIASYFHQALNPYQEVKEINLSFWHLPKYTFYSLCRGSFAFVLSFLFSLLMGYWAAKDNIAEKFLIPLFDVLQSIPVLGFLPGIVLFFVSIFQKNNLGIEIASIFLIFTGQVWNMIFGVYHSIRTIPIDKIECAKCYRFSRFQTFFSLELPSSVFSLIYNSIMSVAGGWFFLMITEAFQLGDRKFQLPGLGSYMSLAASQGDTKAIVNAALMMILLIIILNECVWAPLSAWSQKFKSEETSSSLPETSWFFNVLKHSWIIHQFQIIKKRIQGFFQNQKSKKEIKKPSEKMYQILRFTFLSISFLITSIAIYSVITLIKDVSFASWIGLFKPLAFTFLRVYIAVILGLLVMIPLGLVIGLSEKLSQILQPFIQMAASFPISLLFPMIIMFFHTFNIPLTFGSLILMLLGTQWYILFNVIAGAKAIPSDLKDVSNTFRFSSFQRFFSFYLPAIFPYLVTGILSAAGGAWNASIVAEYVHYQNHILTTPGIGSSISLAAQDNDYPLLGGSILMMVITVALINYHVWLRLYRYSEKRFTLNA